VSPSTRIYMLVPETTVGKTVKHMLYHHSTNIYCLVVAAACVSLLASGKISFVYMQNSVLGTVNSEPNIFFALFVITVIVIQYKNIQNNFLFI
jgi:hypothetical protein